MVTVATDPREALLDKTTLAFLKKLEAQGGPPLYTLTPEQARNVLVSVQQSVSVTLPPAEIEDRRIPAAPTGEVSLRIVRPQGATGTLPGLIYCHGGGWVLGDKGTHDRLVREIANGVQATVVFVDYDRSPEAIYPVALEQIYSALLWTADHGASIGVNPARLAVVGDSVGGNMAAVLAIMTKERQGPKLASQVLMYPVTDADMNTPSYQCYGDGGFWLSAAAMRWFWDCYAPDVALRRDYHLSPLKAPLEVLQGLPPASVIVDENDVLRDEGEAYAHRLQQAGVPVAAERVIGTIHDFALLNPITDTAPVRTGIAQAIWALRKGGRLTDPA
ncbi:esterase [Dictyobacter sp. S3.2.2.5]|uniref:Esterase n=1 Tax=Dictyobacter halimunensis TaxID=3026934 RepID=A0ABQ6G456_9CHLR|nr:esterase [Dictyobacter sp. S3.2.2.5]